MKELLLQLNNGIKEIPKNHQQYVADLQKKGFVCKKDGHYRFTEGSLIGKIDISAGGRAFFCPFENKNPKDWVIKKLPRGIAQNDIVLARLTRIKGRLAIKIITCLYAQKNQVLCYLKQVKGNILAIPLKAPQAGGIALGVSQKSLRALPKSCVVNIALPSKEITGVLGTLHEPLIDEKISLALFDRKMAFSPEAVMMAESFGAEVDPKMYPDRIDLSDLPFCTIDPDDAKDHDDAIYFDSQTSCLYVAIADVSEYVSKDSLLDLEAKERGFSVYFPHICYPMLPPNLSENICSLKENQIRLAFVWRLRLHRRSFEVLEANLFTALIRNHKNISYTNVDRLIAGENLSIPKGVKKSILDFLPVAQKIRSKRLKKGYEFFNDELQLRLDTKGLLCDVRVLYPGPSHTIVEEAMLLANKQAAKLLQTTTQNNDFKRDYLHTHLHARGIYRIHDSPSDERIGKLFFDLKSLGFCIPSSKDLHERIVAIQKQAKKKDMQKQIDKMIIRSQSQALYSSQNIGHFGLGFEAYSHFTSPIRRYSDLILHRLLKLIITDTAKSKKKLAYMLSGVQTACALLNDQERQSAKIEMDFKDRKYARWALENIGVCIQGVMSDDNASVICVAGGIVGARIFVQGCKDDVGRLDMLGVEIIDADVASGKIFGNVCDGKFGKISGKLRI
ncbi:ribonuclease R family protein [Helicobacter sp. 11S02596-1]|uniref:RNB domain-containing ribonuclease n=1 Tax=Helicobacter sp. 11S02596-1 TaxID=1476194 RepID=UPI000BA6FBDF|nr:ribonuclease R family protein [Helicobacter sp. 11S02596-1]PAF43133.1 hypothetical protein BJI48_05145 [Helicobacter sp. 11S02596-1]